MDITPVLTASRQLIRAYGGGKFVVNDTTYESSILVFPELILLWPFGRMEDVNPSKLPVEVGQQRPEIFLIGTGEKQQFLPPTQRAVLRDAYGFSIETMDTGAACRTFNVLMAEDRKVAALLMVG